MAQVTVGEGWAADVCAACDPVFEAADVGFTQNQRGPSAFLWEADPERFAARYPDSGIVESYGSGWSSAPCIDYWIYVETDRGQARLSVEGWNLVGLVVELSGNGELDGAALADVFARILGVRSPRA